MTRALWDPRFTRRQFVVSVAALTGTSAACVGVERKPATEGGKPVQNSRLFSFVGGPTGEWRVVGVTRVAGESLPSVGRLHITAGHAAPQSTGFVLHGVTSNERYAVRSEKVALVEQQAALGRPAARRGALIPIKKNAAWWALTQDERRAILEDRSHHIALGMKYLPAVARRLHHCRDLETAEPFDFVTLFDFAKADEPAFDELVAALRRTEEWTYVEREVDIRMELE